MLPYYPSQADACARWGGTNSIVVQVGTAGAVTSIVKNNVAVKRNGYVYVYFSNESNSVVYFDNFSLAHTHGPLIQETHYSPWGLKLAAISSDALAVGGTTNKYLYNGKEQQSTEFSDGSGLELMDLTARMYDAQIGRFSTQDPWANYMRRWSPYEFAFDNPIRFADPEGLSGRNRDTLGLPQPIDQKKQPKPQLQSTSQQTPPSQSPHIHVTKPSNVNDPPPPPSDPSNEPEPSSNPMPNNITPPSSTLREDEDRENENPFEGIDEIARTMSVTELVEIGVDRGGELANSAAKNTIAEEEIVTQLEDLGKLSKTTARVFGIVGNLANVVTTAKDIKEAWDDPTIGNITKAVGQGIYTAVGIARRSNPIVTTIVVISEVTGFTDWLFDKF